MTIDQWRASSRINFIHPDDREHFLEQAENGFRQGAPYEFEVRLMRHDGECRYFLIRRNPVKDEQHDEKKATTQSLAFSIIVDNLTG